MSRSSKWLALCLAFGLLCAPSLAFSAPLPSSSSVTLSQSEYDQIMAAMEAAQAALIRSNKEIATLSRDSQMLWILSGVLASVVLVEGVALAIK